MSNQLQSVTRTPALTKRIIYPLNCQHWCTPCSTERRLRSNNTHSREGSFTRQKNIATANVCPHTGNNIRNISRNSRNIFKTKHKICARVQQAVSQSGSIKGRVRAEWISVFLSISKIQELGQAHLCGRWSVRWHYARQRRSWAWGKTWLLTDCLVSNEVDIATTTLWHAGMLHGRCESCRWESLFCLSAHCCSLSRCFKLCHPYVCVCVQNLFWYQSMY